MDKPVGRCGEFNAAGSGTTLPVSDDSAGALNDRNERRYIPSMKTRLDDQIDEAERQHPEDVAVASEAGHMHRVLDRAKRFAFSGCEICFRMCRTQNGLRKIRAGSDMKRCPGSSRQKFRFSIHADETLSQHRLIDDPEHGLSTFFQPNKRRPFMPSCDEGARAVYRIKEPA